VQIAKETFGKQGAGGRNHEPVASSGRVGAMPTSKHRVYRARSASAENRSRLRRIVGRSAWSYPVGFFVRTAAGRRDDDVNSHSIRVTRTDLEGA